MCVFGCMFGCVCCSVSDVCVWLCVLFINISALISATLSVCLYVPLEICIIRTPSISHLQLRVLTNPLPVCMQCHWHPPLKVRKCDKHLVVFLHVFHLCI